MRRFLTFLLPQGVASLTIPETARIALAVHNAMTVVRSTTGAVIGMVDEIIVVAIAEAAIAEVAITEEGTVVAVQEAAIDAVAEATVTAEVAPNRGDVAAVVSPETDQATLTVQT